MNQDTEYYTGPEASERAVWERWGQWLRTLGVAQVVAGAYLLVGTLLLMALASFTVFVAELFGLFGISGGPQLRSTDILFVFHVPILMGLVLIPGGVGIMKKKAWGWTMCQAVAGATLFLSIQMLVNALTQGTAVSDTAILSFLLFQAIQIACIVLLSMKDIRMLYKITMVDVVTVLMFACIIALDWNVTMYMYRAGIV